MDVTIFSELIANIVSFLFGFLDGVDLSPIANALATVTPYIKRSIVFIASTYNSTNILNIVCNLELKINDSCNLLDLESFTNCIKKGVFK